MKRLSARFLAVNRQETLGQAGGAGRSAFYTWRLAQRWLASAACSLRIRAFSTQEALATNGRTPVRALSANTRACAARMGNCIAQNTRPRNCPTPGCPPPRLNHASPWERLSGSPDLALPFRRLSADFFGCWGFGFRSDQPAGTRSFVRLRRSWPFAAASRPVPSKRSTRCRPCGDHFAHENESI